MTGTLGSLPSIDGRLAVIMVADAVFQLSALAGDGDAGHFVDEAFKYCKAIAAIGEGVVPVPA